MSTILEVKNVSKAYEGKDQNAVKNISFSLDKGQILTLTGESGSGKTSLLKIIAGLLEPDEGKIYLNGEWVKGPSRRLVPGHPEIKMVYQHYELSPKLNVAQNIKRILRAYVKEYQEERAEELMEICKLQHLRDSFPRELSGGEKQRVALARALAEEPLLLLMDEPFSNIDLSLKAHLKREIIDILEALEITTIIVSHDPQDALSMADQVAVMRQGKLLQLDKPEKIYKQPSNTYIAGLFGYCNIISTHEAKSALNLPTKRQSTLCIRSEDILIEPDVKDSKHQATIKNIRFMGAFYEVAVEYAQQNWVLYHRTNHIKVGDQVRLNIPKDKIITILA
ncbi:ABC-type Fe3+/spermidine/putrescine transport system ATPase subunit [Catalinimonas alkaloidigena]|uniref:ABC transporter ATP-binding protein n=1 Tax=Catalinimonas alkaloidigena TaxID=1075417 RepID=UPI0024075047|nr:ABC transporter ATP-binding protein [Catalinimonas alkaloidigena]MDF9795878.1 ABC-type Fe3+/spermidine/putrescine transport system ATPase subunit [Catalinimonas alkaloidigena]